MKNLFIVLTFISFSFAHAQVSCDSKPFASCKTEDSCFDFFKGPAVDLDVVEGLCSQMEGEFSESGCDRSNVIVSCLTAGNPMMPLVHFIKDYSREEAVQMCTMMGGNVCKEKDDLRSLY